MVEWKRDEALKKESSGEGLGVPAGIGLEIRESVKKTSSAGQTSTSAGPESTHSYTRFRNTSEHHTSL